MEQLVNRRRVMGANTPLPYDYEVAWLQAKDKARIIPDLFNNTSSYVTKWEGIVGIGDQGKMSDRAMIAGYSNDSYSHYCEFKNAKFGCYQNYYSDTITLEEMYDVSMQINGGSSLDLSITIDGTEQTSHVTAGQSTSMGVFQIFGIDSSLVYSGSGIRIGRNKLWYNGQLIRDFIPVVKDNVGYMYDTVSGTLFGDVSGQTEGFIVGPSV